VTLITYLFTEVLDGRNASVADGVTRTLGRAPRDFGEYVRDSAATGVWEVSGRARDAADHPAKRHGPAALGDPVDSVRHLSRTRAAG
jgi:hypothetical protein